MADLHTIAATPDEWWGYHPKHGWLVRDMDDPRNQSQGDVVLLRCSDWSEIKEPYYGWMPPFYTFCAMYIAGLWKDADKEAAEAALVAVYEEFQSKKAELRSRARKLATLERAEEEARRLAEAREKETSITAEQRARQEFAEMLEATRWYRTAWCYCPSHPPLDETLHGRCSKCLAIICPVCGGCFC